MQKFLSDINFAGCNFQSFSRVPNKMIIGLKIRWFVKHIKNIFNFSIFCNLLESYNSYEKSVIKIAFTNPERFLNKLTFNLKKLWF